MSILKELHEIILEQDCEDCELVWVDEEENVLTEAAKRAYKRQGNTVRRMYRCTSGPKKGKVVSDPKTCMTRKDPRKKRIGKKVARERKGVRIRKTKLAKRQATSKLVKKMNARLSGK